jgi:hypothetical protein
MDYPHFRRRWQPPGGFIARRHIERAVAALAAQAGLNGDLYAWSVPPVGSYDAELRIIHLLGHLPPPIRRHPLAESLLRAAVLTSVDEPEPPVAPPLPPRRNPPPPPPPKKQAKAAPRFSARRAG